MMEWISVEDRLPEDTERMVYLVLETYKDACNYEIYMFDTVKCKFYRIDDNGNIQYSECAVYWMYLPEPPKEE